MMKQLLLLIFSLSYISVSTAADLSEDMSYHIKQEYPGNKFSYAISLPGADAWLANGEYHPEGSMPACLIILADHLSKDALRSFAKQLTVTGSQSQELSLADHKGTLHYVELSPRGSAFSKSYYTIQTRDGFNFSDLLTNVGGTTDSMISIEFDRGCKNLATRPYLPKTVNNIARSQLFTP